MENRVGTDCGSGGRLGGGEQRRKNRHNCNRTTIKYLIKREKNQIESEVLSLLGGIQYGKVFYTIKLGTSDIVFQ